MTTPDVPAGYQLVPVAPPRRRGLRPFSWVIVAVNALFLAFIIAAANTSTTPTDCGTLTADTCKAAGQVGAGIGMLALLIIWAVVDVILLVIWAVTRPRQR